MSFFLEVLLCGLLSGSMYSLVALGFVLIYKASGVFNFAQGAQVLFAALTFVCIVERGAPLWVAFLLTLAAMVLIAIAIERVVLRRLVNRPPITLFLATLGLSLVLEGLAQSVWGTQVHGLELDPAQGVGGAAGVGDRRRENGCEQEQQQSPGPSLPPHDPPPAVAVGHALLRARAGGSD